jgi:hypothetical protein
MTGLLTHHYPILKDVWTNHLLPYLLPNVLRMHQQMAVVYWQLEYEPNARSRYVCFWLNEESVGITDPAFPQCVIILHVPRFRHVHCRAYMYNGGDPSYMICGKTMMVLDTPLLDYYYREDCPDGTGIRYRKNWEYKGQEFPPESVQDDCVCTRRALLLRSIRMRNRFQNDR